MRSTTAVISLLALGLSSLAAGASSHHEGSWSITSIVETRPPSNIRQYFSFKVAHSSDLAVSTTCKNTYDQATGFIESCECADANYTCALAKAHNSIAITQTLNGSLMKGEGGLTLTCKIEPSVGGSMCSAPDFVIDVAHDVAKRFEA